MVAQPRSAYLHIPFCHKRCFYCDFSIIPLGDSPQDPGSPGINSINAYLDLVHREISITPKGPALSTIYLGGGTPSILNTAEYGDYVSGPRLITKETKEEMKNILADIQDGTFAKNFVKECDAGKPEMKRIRQKDSELPIEKVGKTLRSMFSWLKAD